MDDEVSERERRLWGAARHIIRVSIHRGERKGGREDETDGVIHAQGKALKGNARP